MADGLTLKVEQEIALGAYGGAELFFADVNGDGRPEILAYQGPGVFGAAMYANWPHVAPAFPRSVCVSAFAQDGRRLWTWGEPNPPDRPYISHAFESCVAAGDVDGDGRVEVILANGRTLHVLEGATGRERAAVEMPHDNFYIVQVLGEPTGPGEAAIVAKNGEGGCDNWAYGEPVVGLNAKLERVWGPVAIPGGGHHILTLDADGDGRQEYLVGYCALKPDGTSAWRLDALDGVPFDSATDHVDYTDWRRLDSGELLLAFAGSSRAYVSVGGRAYFVHPDRHVQGCALGRFRGDGDYYAAFYNDDGPMVLYNLRGEELWRKPTPNLWPLGMPRACEGRVFHRNRPVTRCAHAGQEWIVVSDGGWPWGMDGDGEVRQLFEAPASSRQPEYALPDRARADDMGYGFATQVLDWDGDGREEVLVYDRRYVWVFRPTGCQSRP